MLFCSSINNNCVAILLSISYTHFANLTECYYKKQVSQRNYADPPLPLPSLRQVLNIKRADSTCIHGEYEVFCNLGNWSFL